MWGDTAYLELWLEDEGHKISEVDALETDGKKVTWREMLDEIIKRKQFELTGFSYSSMDEFLTSLYGQYQDFDVGREYLAKEFKSKAKVAWYVDNFGHKHTTPYVLKTNGFQSMVLGRMSYRQLQKMKANSGLQFMWDSGINNTEIYTHFLSNQYEWPSWKFDFDRHDSCNIGELLGILARFANKQVGIYPHKKQILIIMGDDFRFVKAEKAFNCLDTLVRAAGSGKYRNWGQGKKQLELRYSTISEYMQSLQEDKSVQLGSVKGDFGPYNDRRPENYWTGIYSTRPALKYSIRYTERLVKQAESVFALAKLFARKSVSNSGENLDGIALNSTVITLLEGKLTDSQKQLSLGYHHDSITGVCTAQTYKNYMSRLQEANKKAREIISTCMRAVLNSKEAAKGGGDIEYVGPSIGTVYGAESVEDEVETQIEQHGSAYIDSTRCNNDKFYSRIDSAIELQDIFAVQKDTGTGTEGE
ncbi:Alpha-mannosidase F [Zancudomyces culisetae]|uniref:Alpha-mannosidase F n=1 Tax=Zancudomyces culisetae TaxID=1213189 RepID=A0A1R1PE99_ZANCU|nr:Alpha-mannosidase F [Zancudomyces culisetae]|eukprot:OMH79297.1 Alpha-mannosidase F [Zancudomyces culisetae]